jgi:hypothetical protein
MQSRRHPQVVNLDELEATEQGQGPVPPEE